MLTEMTEAFRTTIQMYRDYSGSGMTTLFFLAALACLWFLEKDRSVKAVLVFLATAALTLFFFPVFSCVAIRWFLDDGVYYRFLWLIPMGVIVCCAIVRVMDALEGRRKRTLFALACAGLLASQGSLIYANPAVRLAENAYHLPQSVIDTADILHVDGQWVKAVVPSEMLQFIRQYDTSILMPYGRDMLVDTWGSQSAGREMYQAMEAETVDARYLVWLCQQEKVDYLVMRRGTPMQGSLEDWGFRPIAAVAGEGGGAYDIYMDKHSAFYKDKRAQLGLDAGQAQAEGGNGS